MLKTADMQNAQGKAGQIDGFAGWFRGRYTRGGLWSLFLMCAFPLHAWTLLLAFRDVSWLTERTNAWDAVGVVSYGLIFAFLESAIVFLVMVLLGFLISPRWEAERRIALLSTLALLASLWAMFSQLYFLLPITWPGWLIGLFAANSHPLRALYTAIILIVGASILVPAWFVLRSEKTYRFMRGLIERLSTLSMFYLILDVIGLVIVIIRNV